MNRIPRSVISPTTIKNSITSFSEAKTFKHSNRFLSLLKTQHIIRPENANIDGFTLRMIANFYID